MAHRRNPPDIIHNSAAFLHHVAAQYELATREPDL